jgi:large conductance mechanosensitive channel
LKTFYHEFKTFINKGNALDLAIGLVIGTAFNNIVKSLVSDIIMPLISLLTRTRIDGWFLLLRGQMTFNQETGLFIFSEDAVALYYGRFIFTILDFVIIAFSIFVTLKIIKRLNQSLKEFKETIVKP